MAAGVYFGLQFHLSGNAGKPRESDRERESEIQTEAARDRVVCGGERQSQELLEWAERRASWSSKCAAGSQRLGVLISSSPSRATVRDLTRLGSAARPIVACLRAPTRVSISRDTPDGFMPLAVRHVNTV